MYRYALFALLFSISFGGHDLRAQSENEMKARLEQRLAALEAEYAAGERQLAELEQRRQDLSQTLLRISGAVQVIRELIEAPEPPAE